MTKADPGSGTVTLRLLPWRPRLRPFDGAAEAMSAVDGGDDPAGWLIGLLVGLVLLVFGFILVPLAFLPLEALFLLVILPGYYLLQVVGVVPWQVVERDSRGTVTGIHKITGLRAALAFRDRRRAAGPLDPADGSRSAGDG